MPAKFLFKTLKEKLINLIVNLCVGLILKFREYQGSDLARGVGQGANFFLNLLKRNLPLVYLTLFIFTSFHLFNSFTYTLPITKKKVSEYNIFSAEPLVLGTSTLNLYGMDTRAKKIEGVFRAYNCPMAGTGEYIVEQADKNNIPYWIVPAISFQESLCGKYTPNKGDVESFNAWGWAVYGNTSKAFRNYEHGIKVISEYMSNRFFKRGITETCDIMKVYTPPSKGSWCRGVNYFGDKIQNFVTK